MYKSSLYWLVIIKIFLFCQFSSIDGNASHMIGGEVSYKCLSNDTFLFRIVLYQDCFEGITSIILNDNPAEYAIYENRPVPVLILSGNSASVFNRIVPPEFSNDCISNFPAVCLREDVYEFKLKLPPSSYGYTFVYQRCCRNTAIQNVSNPGTIGVTYYTTIPPFNSGECPNNSPQFINPPPQIICSNNPFIYDFSVNEIDGDSLVYKLCTPYIGASLEQDKPVGSQITAPPFTPVNFISPLSYLNPIPAFPPLSIDAETGIMYGVPLSSGRFLVNVCVDEYKNGEIINTHFREVQFIVTNCFKNVVANTPLFSDEPNTYIINCSDYTVQFKNSSSGGFSYEWDFGDGTHPSNAFEPIHTYDDTGTYIITLYVNKGSTCSDSIKRIVKIYPEVIADFTIEGKLCPGEELQFKESIFLSLEEDYTLFWDFGNGYTSTESNPKITYEEGGTYQVLLQVKTPLGCQIDFVKTITIRGFTPNAGNDTIIVLGYDFHLNASGGDYYEWFPKEYLSDGYIANPRVTFPDTGRYTYVVNINTAENCSGMDTINILVVKEASALLPNAFSPNGDGLNDVLKPMIVGYRRVKLFRIYNRYGEVVFVSFDHYDAWDGSVNGKPCETGVYFYELYIEKIDGTETLLKGDITLLR